MRSPLMPEKSPSKNPRSSAPPNTPRSTNSTSPGQGSAIMSAPPPYLLSSPLNFSSRSVMGVAITRTFGRPPESAAGFRAGSIPITGIGP